MATREELLAAAEVVERWLDAQGLDHEATGQVDVVGEDLFAISALAIAGAPEVEIADAVRLAREAGWDWAPIATVLGIPRQRAVARFS